MFRKWYFKQTYYLNPWGFQSYLSTHWPNENLLNSVLFIILSWLNLHKVYSETHKAASCLTPDQHQGGHLLSLKENKRHCVFFLFYCNPLQGQKIHRNIETTNWMNFLYPLKKTLKTKDQTFPLQQYISYRLSSENTVDILERIKSPALNMFTYIYDILSKKRNFRLPRKKIILSLVSKYPMRTHSTTITGSFKVMFS